MLPLLLVGDAQIVVNKDALAPLLEHLPKGLFGGRPVRRLKRGNAPPKDRLQVARQLVLGRRHPHGKRKEKEEDPACEEPRAFRPARICQQRHHLPRALLIFQAEPEDVFL